MANTSRRIIGRDGKTFLPMNMQGSTGKEYFITVPKLVVMCLIAIYLYLYISFGSTSGFTVFGWIITGIISFLLLQWVIRKFILDENYFFKIYNTTRRMKDVSPDVFWNIPSIRNTVDGSILVYGDMKIGCVLRLERDTIVGKAEESSEKHFDAWSDFYRELHGKNLNFIQMNVMEPSGKDPRLNTLGVTASNASNANIRMALELEMGHLKRISNAMLSEFEYILVYSKQLSRMDTLTDDIIECTYSLLDGAYASVKILNEKEIYDLPKSLFNTLFFNGIQAQINVYKSENVTIPEIMKIYRVTDDSNNKYDIGDKENTVLDKLSTLVNNDELHFGEWSVKDALEGNIEKVNKFNDKKLGSDEADDEEDKALEKKKKKVKKEKNKPLRKDKKHVKNAKNNKTEEAVNESDELNDDDLFG